MFLPTYLTAYLPTYLYLTPARVCTEREREREREGTGKLVAARGNYTAKNHSRVLTSGVEVIVLLICLAFKDCTFSERGNALQEKQTKEDVDLLPPPVKPFATILCLQWTVNSR